MVDQGFFFAQIFLVVTATDGPGATRRLFIPKSGKPMMAAGALPKNELIKVINENLLAKKVETV